MLAAVQSHISLFSNQHGFHIDVNNQAIIHTVQSAFRGLRMTAYRLLLFLMKWLTMLSVYLKKSSNSKWTKFWEALHISVMINMYKLNECPTVRPIWKEMGSGLKCPNRPGDDSAVFDFTCIWFCGKKWRKLPVISSGDVIFSAVLLCVQGKWLNWVKFALMTIQIRNELLTFMVE